MKPIVLISALLISFSAFSHPGIGIVIDSKGSVFYTDLKQIWKIDTQGKKSIVVRGVHSHELYMDKNDNLFGEHLWYNGESKNTWGHYVWRFSADGKFEKVISDTKGFLTNYSFVRDHQGNMYWANRDQACQKIGKKDLSGKISTMGDQCMENIRWMTSSPDGTLYLIDLYDLKKVDPRGHVITLATQLQEKKLMQTFVDDPHQVFGLSLDKDQNVYVAILGGRKVKKITPEGKVSTVLETGTDWAPTGVLSASNGDLWVLEGSATNSVRVERITKDGKKITY